MPASAEGSRSMTAETVTGGEAAPVVLIEMIEMHLALVTLDRPEKREPQWTGR